MGCPHKHDLSLMPSGLEKWVPVHQRWPEARILGWGRPRVKFCLSHSLSLGSCINHVFYFLYCDALMPGASASRWETACLQACEHCQARRPYIQSRRSQPTDTSHPAPHSASRSPPQEPTPASMLCTRRFCPGRPTPHPKPTTNHTPWPPRPEDTHPTCDRPGLGFHPDTYLSTYHSIKQLFVPMAE